VPFHKGTLAPPSEYDWTCFLRPTRVHNLNGKPVGSVVFAQMTTECPYTLQWDTPYPSKLPLPMKDVNLHLIHGSLGPPKSAQRASWSLQLLLQGSLVW